MAWQLIYTSAPRGLVAGRSGFCTVARHREIRDGLVTAIERFSQYDRSGRGAGAPNPVIYAHRIVRLGGSSYHVLSCTRDAGADYTGRTNHLAHHLICEPHELAHAPSPAEVLRQMAWHQTWTEAPRHLGAAEVIDLSRFSRMATLPALTWQTTTGDAGCAALPLESGALAGCYWLYPAEMGEQYLLPLFAESLLLLDPAGRSADKLWQVPFTTYLQATDHAADFFWRGCWRNSPAALAAQGARQTLDFTQPRTLHAPNAPTSELARTGLCATPDPVAPAPVARAEIGEIASLRDPTSGAPELDLAELLASADDESPSQRAWARSKSTATAGKRAEAKAAGKRKLPVKLIVAAGAAIVVSGALAIGFVMWRDGKAEAIRGDLARLRNGGDFTKGPALIASTSGIFRSYEPLKLEIERTQVAAELDALKNKTPDDATKYLVTHRERLAAATVQNDAQIKARLDKLDQWRKADERLGLLSGNLASETFREPTAGVAIKKAFDDEARMIAKIDESYRPTIEKKLAELRQLYVRRRLEALEQAAKDGAIPAGLELVILELTRDAERLAVAPELKSRIEQLDQQRAQKPPVPKPELSAPPAATPSKQKTGESKDNSGLPVVPTYIAVLAGKKLSVAGVPEMQQWNALPNGDPIRLFRQPSPPLSPAKDRGQDTTVSGGKVYDGGAALLSLKRPDLTIFDDKAKELLGRSFGLLFGSASGGFYLYCGEGGELSAPLLTLPSQGSWEWERELAMINLSSDLVTALSRIKLAEGGRGELIFRAQGWGERELPFALEKNDAPLSFRITPVIEAIEREIHAQKSLPPAAKPQSMAGRVLAAKEARDLLMGKDDKTGLSRAGLAVFDGKDDGLSKDARLATTNHYINPVKGAPKQTLKDGRQFVTYTRELFSTLLGRIDNEIGDAKAALSKLDRTKGKDREATDRLDKRVIDLQNQKAAVEGILASFEKLESMPGFNKVRCDKAVELWTNLASLNRFETDPTNRFHENWRKVFSMENIEKIRPFLEWNLDGQHDGDLDQAVASLSDAKPTAPESAEGNLVTLLARTKSDLPSLGPFSIDLKTSGGNMIRLVTFSDRPGAAGTEPMKAAK